MAITPIVLGLVIYGVVVTILQVQGIDRGDSQLTQLGLALAGVVLAFYYVYTGDVVPDWPVLVPLAIIVAQTSYGLITRETAAKVERTLNPGPIGPDTLRRDLC